MPTRSKLSAVVFLSLVLASPAQADFYKLINLGTLEHGSEANAIESRGRIVGASSIGWSGGVYVPFMTGPYAVITTTARMPSSCALSATACPWLPEDYVITPAARAEGPSCDSTL